MKVLIYTVVVMFVSIYGYEKFYKPRYGKKDLIVNNPDLTNIMTRVENYLNELTGRKIDRNDIKKAVEELFQTN